MPIFETEFRNRPETTVFESNVAALTLTGQVRHVGGRHPRTSLQQRERSSVADVDNSVFGHERSAVIRPRLTGSDRLLSFASCR